MWTSIFRGTIWSLALAMLSSVGWAQPPADTPEIVEPNNVIVRPMDPPLTLPPAPETEDWLFAPRRFLGGAPGFYFDVELAFVFSDVMSRTGGSLRSERTDFGLNTTAAPTFVLGYNFASTMASVYSSYRFIGTDGRPNYDDGTDYRTSLDFNDFNWVYQRRFSLPSDRFRLAWEAGIRLDALTYNLCASTVISDSIFAPSTFEVHGSQTFVGAGPTLGLTSDYEIMPGMTLFTHADFGVLFGQTEYRATVYSNHPLIDYIPEYTERTGATVKAIKAAIGLNWAPMRTPRMSYQLGYQFDYLWDIGRFDDVHDDLMFNGLFFRCRFNF